MSTLSLTLTDEQEAALQAVCDRRNARRPDAGHCTLTPADVLIQHVQHMVDQQKAMDMSLLPDAIKSLDPDTQKKVQEAVASVRKKHMANEDRL